MSREGLKVLFGMPLRQTTGFVQSLLRLVDLDWSAPDFSTLCRRQKTLNVSLLYRGSTGPLNLLIPSRCCKQQLPGSALCPIRCERARRAGRPSNSAGCP